LSNFAFEIIPEGRFGKVNKAGINYYNKLIDALVDKGHLI